MILEQPVDAIGSAALLVGGERDDDIAIGYVLLAHHTNGVGDEDRRHGFVVGGAAAIVVAIAFSKYERIEIRGPIGLERFDDVDVCKQEQRLAGAGTTVDPYDGV